MNQRDLMVRIDSDFKDKGFKSAEASAKAMVRELDRQEKAVRDLAKAEFAAHREAERMQAARVAGMEKVGRGALALGAVTAIGLGLAAKAAMDWETAWTGVTKTVSGSADEMAELEGQLRQLAKTLPATHEEIAGVAEAAGQLGIRRQDVAAFTKTMIDLGVSTNLTSDEAATGIAQISNVMGTLKREGTEGVSKFGATLVALGNAGASTEADILQMAQRLAGAGKLVGASESDVLALANALSSMGIESELGGGAVSRTMTKIYSAVKGGGQGLQDFATIAGMTGDQFAAAFGADPVRAMDSFIQGLNRIDASGGNVVQSLDDVGISGTQDLQVLLRLKGAGDLLTQSLDLGNKSWEENIALVNEANKRYETAASKVAIARNNLNDAAIDIGGTILPAIAGAADRVGFLAQAFGDLPGPVKEAATALGVVVVAVASVGGLAMLAIPKLAAMNATLAATGPAGAKAAAGLSRAGGMLAGPLGLALTAATVLMGVWVEKQYEANQRAEELAETLDKQSGALTENSRQWAISTLLEDGTLERAKAMGINLDDLTDAALGNADAQKRVNEQLAWAQTFMNGSPGDIAKVRAAITGQNEALEAARSKWELANEAMSGTAPAAGDAATATGALGTELGETGAEAKRAADEVNALTKAVLDYGETLAEQRDANRAFEGAKDDVTEGRQKTKDDLVAARLKAKGVDKKDLVEGRLKGDKDITADDRAAAEKWADGKVKDATAAAEKWAEAQIKAGAALDTTTDAGRKNEGNLDALAEKIKALAVKNFENGDSLDSVTAKVLKSRAEFVKMATDLGMSSEKANALADDLGLTRTNIEQLTAAVEQVPTTHVTTFSVNTEAALARIAAFKKSLAILTATGPKGVHYTNTENKPGGGHSNQGGLDFAGGGYTGDINRSARAGNVHGREFVSDADTTAQWRGLLEHMHAGGDPRAFFSQPSVQNIGGASSQSWDYGTKVNGPITVVASEPRTFARAMQRYNTNRGAS